MWMRARASASRSSALLAQVAGTLGDVGLDAHAGRGDARDPHHVVGAQLDPVERVGHGARAPRPGRAGAAGSSPSSAPNAPIHCGSDERATAARARSGARAASSSSPSPSASSASRSRRKISCRPAGCVRPASRCSRAAFQSPLSNARSEPVSNIQSRHAGAAARHRGESLLAGLERVGRAAGEVERCRPGSSRPLPMRLKSSSSRAMSIAARRHETPSSTSPSAIWAIPSVLRTSLSARLSPAARAASSATLPSLNASR